MKVGDLIKGAIIQSGNDASIVLAETIAGTEGNFVGLMNRKATELGLSRSSFGNATGLNDPQNRSTARDLAKMAELIIRDFPEFYTHFGEKEFTWNNIKQANRNPLLTQNIGADGLKTGYLEESGYGLVGSAVQNGQRLILVVMGAKTIQERQAEARKILEWGFRAFESRSLFAENEVLGSASVFGGAAGSVAVTAGKRSSSCPHAAIRTGSPPRSSIAVPYRLLCARVRRLAPCRSCAATSSRLKCPWWRQKRSRPEPCANVPFPQPMN